MYQLKSTVQWVVIDVRRIIRAVHVIPRFGRVLGQTNVLLEQMEDVVRLHQALRSTDGSAQTPPPAMLDPVDYYDEFWLNCWLDYDICNRVF